MFNKIFENSWYYLNQFLLSLVVRQRHSNRAGLAEYTFELILDGYRISLYSRSFVLRVERYWNVLPADAVSDGSLNGFKCVANQWLCSQ